MTELLVLQPLVTVLKATLYKFDKIAHCVALKISFIEAQPYIYQFLCVDSRDPC